MPGSSSSDPSRIDTSSPSGQLPPKSEAPHVELVARDALVELGWSVTDAERALTGVDRDLPVEEQVRAALRKAA